MSQTNQFFFTPDAAALLKSKDLHRKYLSNQSFCPAAGDMVSFESMSDAVFVVLAKEFRGRTNGDVEVKYSLGVADPTKRFPR